MKTAKSPLNVKTTTLVHVAPTPFFANRGCHIRIANEIAGLRQHGVKVILCTYGLGSDVDGIDIRRIFRIPGYIRTEAGFSGFKFIADILLFFLVLRTVWQQKTSVIIHGHLHEGGLIGWAVKKTLFWRPVALVMDVQGSLSGELAAYGSFRRIPFVLKFFRGVERFISRLPDKIICSSPSSRQIILSTCGALDHARIDLLEDVVPDSFFASHDKARQKQLRGWPDDRKIVIYTGSLLPGKGVDILLEAMRQVLASRPETLFVLGGYPKEWIEAYASRHDLDSQIVIPGEILYTELAEYLHGADLAVDPKLSAAGEASGKILHYMACGLCTVCFPTENNRRFLGAAGFFAEAETAAALAHAIEMALTDDAARNKYGALCRQQAKSQFSLEAAGERLLEIYKELFC